MNKVLNRIHKMESKFQPKTEKVPCSDFNKKRWPILCFKIWIVSFIWLMDLVQLLHHNYSCFVLVRSKWRMEELLFFNLCFQLSGLCWFSDYTHRQKISSWRQRKVFLLREKSAKKEGVGDKKISKILTFLTWWLPKENT